MAEKVRVLKSRNEIYDAGECLCKILDYPNTLNSDFSKEKELVDFIVEHINEFTRLIFNDEVISFWVDYEINKKYRLSPRGRRIDIFIVGKKKKYIVETKCPKAGTESRAAIGQILDYGREFSDSEKDMVIITSKFDPDTAKTIKFYNLPIRYIYFSKKFFAEYIEEAK